MTDVDFDSPEILSPEETSPEVFNGLTPEDQEWLAEWGVDPSWQEDGAREELEGLVAVANTSLLWGHARHPDYELVVGAREKFLAEFIGIDPSSFESYRLQRPELTKPSTFIPAQRAMQELGLDVVKVINGNPGAMKFGPESVKTKVNNLKALGIDAARVINHDPRTLNCAPESVRDKVDNLKALGLDPVKLINTHPGALNFAPESVKTKVYNLKALGLDPVRLINAYASTLNFAPESVKDKVDNLKALGLDPGLVINTCPTILNMAPESINSKVKLINRSIKVLQWQFSAKELIEIYPAILGFNNQKLRILRRIAAEHMDISSRLTTPPELKSRIILPLENYLIQIDKAPNPTTFNELYKKARNKDPKRVRQDKTELIARSGRLGRIGSMYLDYRGLDRDTKTTESAIVDFTYSDPSTEPSASN